MTKLIQTAILTITLLCGYTTSKAQYYYLDKASYTLGLGSVFYNGDLDQKIGNLSPAASLALTLPIAEKVHLRFNALYGSYAAADSTGRNQVRNLSFKSPLYEVGVLVVYEPFKNSRNGFFRKSHLSPYAVYGANFFYMSPMANYKGQWYDLQELGTEGQNLPSNLANSYPKPYKKYQFAIPFGFGLSYYINSKVSINAEFTYHFTFTDYMDDVGSEYYPDADIMKTYNPIAAALSNRSSKTVSEQVSRGNPGKKDGYLVPMLSFTYHIPQKRW